MPPDMSPNMPGMTLADLAAWTPVALSLAPPQPSIDWGDLRGVRFTEPFFDQTVERWAGDDPAPLVRTDLGTLLALDEYAASLDPSLLIFHLSRCGSTLLSRLVGCLPDTLMVCEPRPVNALLGIEPGRVDRTAQIQVLRLLVRALGRRRFGDERHFALKLSSWNILHLGLFRAAFPHARIVWAQREPAEILASLLATPAGWMAVRNDPAQAAALFGGSVDCGSSEGFIASVLATMLAAAEAGRPDLVVDYRELPEAAWAQVAPLVGIVADPVTIDRMRRQATYSAKDSTGNRFAGDPPERRALVERVAGLADATLGPLYRALDRRRPSF